MATWKALLEQEMRARGETLADLESSTFPAQDMEKEFDAESGHIHGQPFTAWTAKTVYFPVGHDGIEWVGSVSRHPDGKPTEHQGGGE